MKINIRREGISLTSKYISENGKILGISTTKYSWEHFNPFKRFKSFQMKKFYNKIHNEFPQLKCEACGEGIIEFKIKDPNRHENQRGVRRLKVCKHCVEFYDQHWSKEKVEMK